MPSRKVKPTTVDEYLAAVSRDKRSAPHKIRNTIQGVVPEAQECPCYGMPALRFRGKPLIAYRAAARHCALHPMSGLTVATLKNELAHYDTSKGAIRFPADAPTPKNLIRKIIKNRLAEIQAEC